MRSVFKFLILLCIACPLVKAQSLAVTATITDSDGQNWSNGTWSVQLVSPGGTPVYNGAPVPTTRQSGSLDNSGNLSVTLYYTATIGPAGAYYNWIICPLASFQCSVFNLNTVSSNMTSLINPRIMAPRFPAGATSYGYADAEVYPTPPPGGIYYNVLTPIQRIWNGTAWINNGSGSGGGGTVTSVGIGTTPSWLNFSVANPNTTPVISVAASAIPNSALANSSTNVNGQTCPLGSSCTITASATSIAVGTTTITGGTSGDVLIDNGGILGNTSTLLNISLGTTTTGQAAGNFSILQVGNLNLTSSISGTTSVLEGLNISGAPTWILANQTGAATFLSMTTPDAVISGGSIDGTPIGNTTRSNAYFSTTATSGNAALYPINAATSTTNYGSPNFQFDSNYWTGTASAQDVTSLYTVPGSGTNPSITLELVHSGSSGALSFEVPALQIGLSGQTITGIQGTTGTKFAAATGTFTNGNLRKTDSNGNEIDAAMNLILATGSGCSLAASSLSQCSTTVSLATAEPSTAYSVVGCTATGTTNSVLLGSVGSLTTTSFSVTETNSTTSANIGGTITCLVVGP